jgi:hypothetical protein
MLTLETALAIALAGVIGGVLRALGRRQEQVAERDADRRPRA